MITSRAQEIYAAEFDRIFFKLPEQIRERLETKISELGTKLNSFPIIGSKVLPIVGCGWVTIGSFTTSTFSKTVCI